MRYKQLMSMRRNYLQLEEYSDVGDGTINDLQFASEISKEFVVPRQKPARHTLNTEHTKQKLTEVRSIYLDNMTSDTKAASKKRSSNEQKINADELIRVLQNGRDRRNQRRQKADISEKGEYSIGLQKNYSEQEEFRTEPRPRPSQESFERARQQERESNRSSHAEAKLIQELKSERKKTSKSKDEEQWKEIESLLYSKPIEVESPHKRNKRREELEAAKELLTGKVSIIWIFVISGEIEEEDKLRILKMYSGLSDCRYIVPLVKEASEMNSFLEIPNSLFKIVSDLANMTEVLRSKVNSKVVEFFIYNTEGDKGIAKCLSYKSESRKVKGIYNQLEKIIDRAEEEIQNQIQLFHSKNGLAKRRNVKKFPSFMKLSGEDKTYATLYRANLYGAKNLPKEELPQRFDEFMELVEEKYGRLPHEQANISNYSSLNHFSSHLGEAEAHQIVRFYVKQSFYYQILNSMLRTMKTTEEFRPCIFPFYENYHAIKHYYNKDLSQSLRKIKAQTLYRGAKLRKRDFNVLQPGVFIEMFGFMSTSKNLQRALQFTDQDGYVFVIHIPEMTIPSKYDHYDHGFVDINRHGLADKEFEIEEQVLFNALNVYKVLRVEESGEYTKIHLEYGPIFGLMAKEKKELSSDEKDVLLNFQHCSHLLNGIEDQGDVHLLANQFEESKQYYVEKLKTKVDDGKYYYKLANVQQQCGELDEADKNVKVSLEIQMKQISLNDREKCLKVFSIHSKNAEISLDKEDYLTADEAITTAIEFLTDEDEFEKGKKLRERGEVRFKKGQIREAEEDFYLSEKILKSLTQKAEDKRKKVNRSYFFSFLTLICSSTTSEEIEEEKQERLKEIDELEKQIQNMKEEIEDELIKVNNSMKEAAIYAEDKQKYHEYVNKARAYLLEIQSRETNDPREKARIKALEATIQDYLELAETEKLLYEAIELVEKNEPFDPTVGKYSEILATFQKKELEKYTNPKAMALTKLEPGMQKLQYNQSEHLEIYKRCRSNFQKALNVLVYNTKTSASPEVMSIKNKIGELDFNESNFEQCEKIIQEVKQQRKDCNHSEISKSCLLLSKISYARGELKDSFQNAEEALKTLRAVLLKREEQQYQQIFECHSITLEIKTHRARIYLRQLNHDCCLKDIRAIKEVIDSKLDYSESHSLLADLIQIQAENYIFEKKGGDFDQFFLSAIKLREKQLGAYNLPNAVTYANYSKNLVLAGDLEEARSVLEKSLEIFGCFSEDHPITWLVLYCASLLNERSNNLQECLMYLEKCLTMARQKFDKSHITLSKIRLQYAKNLHSARRFQKAIEQFESLQNDLENELSASQSRNHVQNEKDDEKVTVKRFLYSSLRESYMEVNKTTQGPHSSESIHRISQKMEDLKRTYKLEGSELDEKMSQ